MKIRKGKKKIAAFLTAMTLAAVLPAAPAWAELKASSGSSQKAAGAASAENSKAADDIVGINHQKYAYREYINDVLALRRRYKKWCRYKVWGKSPDNRNIVEVTIGNSKAKKHLVVFANIHAREYMTTQLVMRQMEITLRCMNETVGGKKISTILKNVQIHYFPSINPDGTAISQYGFGAIRNASLRQKLRKMNGASYTTYWKANARGVDLNRNWDYGFYQRGSRGWQGFSGTKAFSEPEIKAVKNAVDSIIKSGKLLGILNYHSTGSMIYGKTISHGKANSTVRYLTAKMTSLASERTGYYVMPTDYSTSGGYAREYWLYGRGIPIITVEVGTEACPLPASQFMGIWLKNYDLALREASMLSGM